MRNFEKNEGVLFEDAVSIAEFEKIYKELERLGLTMWSVYRLDNGLFWGIAEGKEWLYFVACDDGARIVIREIEPICDGCEEGELK